MQERANACGSARERPAKSVRERMEARKVEEHICFINIVVHDSQSLKANRSLNNKTVIVCPEPSLAPLAPAPCQDSRVAGAVGAREVGLP